MQERIQKWRTLVYKKALTKLLSNRCPGTIPRSGEEGTKVNCYIVTLNEEEKLFLLADKISKNNLRGRAWDVKKHRYQIDTTVPLDQLHNYKLIITHYYGLYEIRYDGLLDYVFSQAFLVLRLRIWWSKVLQYLFNQKNLFRLKRIELLRILINRHVEQEEDDFADIFTDSPKEIDIWPLMNELYSAKWFGHPSGTREKKRLKLYLDSFVATEDLEKTSNGYRLKPKAVATLTAFEQEERRHSESVKTQRRIASLTLVIAGVAILTFLNATKVLTFIELLEILKAIPSIF